MLALPVYCYTVYIYTIILPSHRDKQQGKVLLYSNINLMSTMYHVHCVPCLLCTMSSMYRVHYASCPLCTMYTMYRVLYVPCPLCTTSTVYHGSNLDSWFTRKMFSLLNCMLNLQKFVRSKGQFKITALQQQYHTNHSKLSICCLLALLTFLSHLLSFSLSLGLFFFFFFLFFCLFLVRLEQRRIN